MLRSLLFGLALSFAGLFWACSPLPKEVVAPTGDFSPPAFLSLTAVDGSSLVLSFDEEIRALEGSYVVQEGEARAEGQIRVETRGRDLALDIGFTQSPGAAYRLAGEVEDFRANRTRFVLDFTGYNSRPPSLRLSEVRTERNSSIKTPHRDYVELEILAGGNLGGLELSWSSSTKILAYRFPAAEVGTGDILLLHLSPEGKAEEVDELGSYLGLSGGVDALAGTRDLWTSLGALSDASGALLLRERPAGKALDGLFYADETKAGPLPEGRIRDLVLSLAREGLWKIAEGGPSWEEAVAWKPSASHSFVRMSDGSWAISATGAESPGLPNP